MEKFIFLSKVLYHCLNMMPKKIQFELNFKLYTYLYDFQLDQKQQKTSQNHEISAIFSKNLKFWQIFSQNKEIFAIFSKNFKFFQFFPIT